MKSTNTFGAHFTIRQQKELNGKSPINARLCVNKTRVEISIKTSLALSDWNKGRGCAKPRTDELRALNTYLEEVRSKPVVQYQELKIFRVKNFNQQWY
ncbi:MAG: hypothetical protein H7Z13_18495 [Ferruginibacter sp.]|nr:hypothetical protein [Ferruginibacter sp.]